jgi:hypothetical protein
MSCGEYLKTNPVRGAMCAQQLHAGSGKVSFQAGDIDMFLASGRHLQLLVSLWDSF